MALEQKPCNLQPGWHSYLHVQNLYSYYPWLPLRTPYYRIVHSNDNKNNTKDILSTHNRDATISSLDALFLLPDKQQKWAEQPYRSFSPSQSRREKPRIPTSTTPEN